MSAVLREPAERVAPMRLHDLPEVLAVEEAAYQFPWTRGNFVDSLSAGHSGWTMRDSGGSLIAYAVVMIAVDEAHLLIVTSDRLSAFDVVLPDPIPGKGAVLTELSNFWFARTAA